MVLSLLSSTGISAAAENNPTAVQTSHGDALSSRSMSTRGQKFGEEAVSMPLVLDKSSIGFMADSEPVEVTAYMTDIKYLGMTLEEYASFIPVTVDMDYVDYLDREQREYVASMTEERRISYRAQAEAKLQLKKQFIWEAAINDQDFSNKLEITPITWTIYEATQDQAPMLACTALVEWIGPAPAPVATTNTQDPTQQIDSDLLNRPLNQGGTTTDIAGNSVTGELKDITKESKEVQDFLWEMYLTGGLTQADFPYDWSYF